MRYAQYIYQRTQREDLAQVAHDDGLSQDTVRSIFERGATKRLPSGGYPPVQVLCLDEITTHKGRGHYRLVISARGLGLVLDILPDRSKESLAAWLAARGGTWWAQVEVCCADMWNAYHGVAQTQLPQAPRVVDRFHVMKNLTAAVTKARRSIQKQADQATQAVLKAGRWLLVKNAEHLTAEEGEKLAQMLAVSPELKTCYDLKESCRTWFDTSADRQAADSALLD